MASKNITIKTKLINCNCNYNEREMEKEKRNKPKTMQTKRWQNKMKSNMLHENTDKHTIQHNS